ncbi:hypothetical protein BJ322DRAFT_1103068 [Thelephora terrestris]|uniref:Uncharacterized protein n=1 Tax=Thelephora terrestris TaxID=56493 RepID=A0A9P6HQT4_9AGAM|nr:hypothetical protein BJ322DRAFT_1103068 [Thelephora terrestris]
MDLYFSALDELIQIIYQGSAKFVLMSRVDYTSWIVHLGLSGPEGRWWRGKWTEENVKAITGPKPTEDMLEAFGGRLANTIVSADVMVGNWSPEKGTKINVTLGTAAKKPMVMHLTELSPSDAAAFATKEFLSIALEAQTRKCRLNAPTFGLPPLEPSYPVKVSVLNKDNDGNRATANYSVDPVSSSASIESSGTCHESLKAKQDNSVGIPVKRLRGPPSPDSKPVSTQPVMNVQPYSNIRLPQGKGVPQPKTRVAGIPKKRTRTVKAMEFGSDDE